MKAREFIQSADKDSTCEVAAQFRSEICKSSIETAARYVLVPFTYAFSTCCLWSSRSSGRHNSLPDQANEDTSLLMEKR